MGEWFWNDLGRIDDVKKKAGVVPSKQKGKRWKKRGR